MKKTPIIILLLTIIITSLITAASRCYVSGNTFKIPSGNEENNQYHTYNIDNINNKTNNHKNKQNNNIPKNNSHSSSTNNIPEVKHFYNNTNDNKNKSTNNKPDNNKPNNKPDNKPDNKPNNNKPVNTISTNKPKKSRERTYKKQNPDTITKIEFKNHFIKIKAGSSKNILLKTHPAESRYTGMVYKSNNNSIAVYKDNKLTAIKKGFTTILIMLKDGTVKAACPVKVV